MLLPQPSIVTLPKTAAPHGVGIGACNSGNSCGKQSCDVNKPKEDDGCNWNLGCVIIGGACTLAAGAAGA